MTRASNVRRRALLNVSHDPRASSRCRTASAYGYPRLLSLSRPSGEAIALRKPPYVVAQATRSGKRVHDPGRCGCVRRVSRRGRDGTGGPAVSRGGTHRTAARDIDDACNRAPDDGPAPTGPGPSARRHPRRTGAADDTADAAPATQARRGRCAAGRAGRIAPDELRGRRREHRLAAGVERDLRRTTLGPARSH